jgi:hypothetical protein
MKDKERLEKKRDILEKLFNLAMHEDTPEEEAHTAMEKATEIMAKEKIAIADVMRTTDSKDFITNQKLKYFYGKMRGYQDWENQLVSGLCRAFDCSFIRTDSRTTADVFGHETDVENVVYFFAYIQFKIAGKIRSFRTETEKNAYGRGFVVRITERLQEMYKKIEDIIPSDCRDLMVIRKDLANKKKREKYPNITYSSPNAIRDYQAYERGLRDGGKLAIRRGINGSSTSRTQIN